MTDEDKQLALYASRLADGIEAALAPWVERCVDRTWTAHAGEPPPAPVRAAAALAGRRAVEDVMPRLRTLLYADVDEQGTTPLALLRQAVRYPSLVLSEAGVPPLERDEFSARAFPDDPYDLTPASFADLSAELVDAGMAWGAAKAFVHRRRHRAT